VDAAIVLRAQSGLKDEQGNAQDTPTVVIGQQSYLTITIDKVGITDAGIDVNGITLKEAVMTTTGVVSRNGSNAVIKDILYENGANTDKGTFNNLNFNAGDMQLDNPTASLQFKITDCSANSGNNGAVGCLDVVPTGDEADTQTWEVNLEVDLEVSYTADSRRRRRRLLFKGISSRGGETVHRSLVELDGTARTVITQGMNLRAMTETERVAAKEQDLIMAAKLEQGTRDNVAAAQEATGDLTTILIVVAAVVAAIGLTLCLRMYMKKKQTESRKTERNKGVSMTSNNYNKNVPDFAEDEFDRQKRLVGNASNNVVQPSQQSRPPREMPNSPAFSSSSNEVTSYRVVKKVRGDYAKQSRRASNGAARMAAEEHRKLWGPTTQVKGHYQGDLPHSHGSRGQDPGPIKLDGGRDSSRASEDHSSDGESSDQSVVRDGVHQQVSSGPYRAYKGSPALSTSLGSDDQKRMSPLQRAKEYQEA